jgi:predicted dienelactone hydrolase
MTCGLLLVGMPVHASPEAAGPPLIIVSYDGVSLERGPGSPTLALRITLPIDARGLPVIVFSHGASLTRNDYQPLVGYWASHGFLVIQPEHEDAARAQDDPVFQHVWRLRVQDIHRILDNTARLALEVPILAGAAN